ncbi:MAG: DUF5103 domain-containing protein [Flavisolibacter sp.]
MKFLSLLYILVLFVSAPALAQMEIFDEDVRSVKLYRSGDQTSFPLIELGSADVLQLEFDDMSNDVKNYYYTFELRNADWSPTMLRPFEYIKGFQNNRISTYRNSSLAAIPYIHYQATLPDRNCYPSLSGNYLLKVFLNNDTSQLVFTKRFVVVKSQTQMAAQVQQPFNATLFRTGQKLQIAVQTDSRIRVMSPSDIKVAVLQNNNWQTALYLERPTIARGNYYEYSDEAITGMQAGKEFRYLDMRSLRLMSDRMQRIQNVGDSVFIYVKPEAPRNGEGQIYYRDLNGSYTIEALESINPFWQGEYAFVKFTFAPPRGRPIQGSDVYIFGEMTNYATDNSGKMDFNEETGLYEKTLFLKQGYYNYLYVTKPVDALGPVDFSQTEGNFWATENQYTVLVYYRPFGARADELIGFATINSNFERAGY